MSCVRRARAAPLSSSATPSPTPDISTVIVGALDPAHLRENVRTLEKGPLAPDVMAEVHRRLEPLGFRVAPAR